MLETQYIREAEFHLATQEAQRAIAAWQIAYGRLMRTLNGV